jgi:hypothetical protein
VPTAVINVDSKIAAAMVAAPINMGIEDPGRSGVTVRYPGYSLCLLDD